MLRLRSHVTPVVITFNEELNLRRCLDSLRWAKRVLVVDSASTDGTRAIAETYQNADFRVNRFESFGKQWKFALEHGQLDTDFVLALDADMIVPPELSAELDDSPVLGGGFDAALVPFEMRLWGVPLHGTLYPPDIRLFRASAVRIGDRAQHHSFAVDGPVYRCKHRLIHDDRKTLDRWIQNQQKYSQIEATRIMGSGPANLKDRLRAAAVMPPLMAAFAYLRAGGPLAGKAAVRYAYERLVAESLKSMRLIENDLAIAARDGHSTPSGVSRD
ncbi:MAG: glycosyltransferase family 2 protein [Deltaproteobacteria bacterium]|nr:glycosyltransferase family 2 protein [Deltaproteobacteria bacterium]